MGNIDIYSCHEKSRYELSVSPFLSGKKEFKFKNLINRSRSNCRVTMTRIVMSQQSIAQNQYSNEYVEMTE